METTNSKNTKSTALAVQPMALSSVTTTPNLQLEKPAETDFYDIGVFNANVDKIDAAVADKANKSELPNIKKNPSDTTGDIIDTHLTVGTRTGDCGEKSFTSGNSHTASGQFSACVGGHGNKVTEYDSVCLGGYMNECTAQFAACAGGYENQCMSYYTACLGGRSNQAAGSEDICAGGVENKCSGTCSACIGGYQNETTGQYGICLGGNNNSAGQYQGKMGHYAKDGESHTD